MNPSEHILTWIECSAPHHARLLNLSRTENWHDDVLRAREALSLAVAAYYEMIHSSDASKNDHDAGTILGAGVLIADWRPEQ